MMQSIYDNIDFQAFYAELYEAKEILCNIYLNEIPRGARLLDLACGSGKLALTFARKLDARVQALDLSPSFFAESKRIAEVENLDCRFVGADMRSFSFDEKFDVICSLGNTLNYMKKMDDIPMALS